MTDATKRLAARQAQIDHIKTQLAAPALRAAKAEERAHLFRELVILRQEYGRLVRLARGGHPLIQGSSAPPAPP